MDAPAQRRATRRKFPFLYGNPDIPADKMKIAAKLDIMKLDGWKALESMTIDELDALQAEAESAIINVDEFGFTGFENEHDRAIIEAREAIKQQRIRTRKKIYDERTKQDQRRNNLICAALSINKAVNLLEEAAKTEQDPVYCGGLLPRYDHEIDPSDMSDGELRCEIDVPTDPQQSTPSEFFIHLMLTVSTRAWKKYAPCFLGVIFGGKTPEEALELQGEF